MGACLVFISSAIVGSILVVLVWGVARTMAGTPLYVRYPSDPILGSISDQYARLSCSAVARERDSTPRQGVPFGSLPQYYQAHCYPKDPGLPRRHDVRLSTLAEVRAFS